MSHATDASPLSDEHAGMLAKNWWAGEMFIQRGEYSILTRLPSLMYIQGVPCCEGPFTLAETARVQDAIRQYQMVRLAINHLYILTMSLRPPVSIRKTLRTSF